MKQIRGFAFALLALTATGSAMGQIAKSGAGYIFRVNYSKGQVLQFQSVNKIDNTGSPDAGISVNVPITLRVLEKKAGVATIKFTMGDIKLGGQVVQPGNSMTFPLDNRNRSGDAKSQGVGVAMPLKPIRVGALWEAKMPVNLGMGMQLLEGTYRFAGIKTVKGHAVAFVTYSLKGAAEGTGTMMLLTKDGTLYSNETRLSVPSMSRMVRMHQTMTRIQG